MKRVLYVILGLVLTLGLIFPLTAQATICGECEGGVTALTLRYLGAGSPNIEVKAGDKLVFSGQPDANGEFSFVGVGADQKLGKEIKVYVNGTETKIHTSCSQPIGPGLVVGDFEVVEGTSLKGGKLCPVSAPPSDDECGECVGKVTTLTLQNIGLAGLVVVTQKDGKTVYNAVVPAGGQFTFTGQDKKGTLGTEIKILVDGIENVKIHTSCSQPIGIDMKFGDFVIIDGASLDGGKFCPPPAAPSIDVEKEVQVDPASNPPWEDADEATGPTAHYCVRFRYIITNTGDVELNFIELSDNRIPAVSVPVNTTLAPGAQVTVYYPEIGSEPASIPAESGQYENIATATGYYAGHPYLDTDYCHYFGDLY